MPSSGMFRRVACVRTDVSEERIASIITLERIGELGIMLTVSSSWRNDSFTLMLQAIISSETSVAIKATRCHIPEDDILHVSDFFDGSISTYTSKQNSDVNT
jgi:hypothetical protein